MTTIVLFSRMIASTIIAAMQNENVPALKKLFAQALDARTKLPDLGDFENLRGLHARDKLNYSTLISTARTATRHPYSPLDSSNPWQVMRVSTSYSSYFSLTNINNGCIMQ